VSTLALAVPFYSLSMITEAVIKGKQEMHLIPVGNFPGNAVMVFGSLAVLWLGYGVLAVASVVVISRILTCYTLHKLAMDLFKNQPARRVRWTLAWCLLYFSRIFLWSDGIAALGASLYGLLLSKCASEREVGMLSAAFQLLQPIQILYRSVGHSAFPALVTAAKTGQQAVAALAHRILSHMLRLSFPACVTVFLFAGEILNLVYGSKGFGDAAMVLQILSLSLLLEPLNPILGHALWAVGAERNVFRIVVVNVFSSILLGLPLIGSFGLTGAACGTLLGSILSTGLHYWTFERRIGNPMLLLEVLRTLPVSLVAIAIILFCPWPKLAVWAVAMLIYGSWTFAIAPNTWRWLNYRPT
jgi:O-antigen/teichoic acid export membrane protein